MAEEEVSKLSVDTKSAIQDVYAFSKTLSQLTNEVKSLAAATIKYDTAGNDQSFTMRQTIANGDTLVSTFKRIDAVLDELTGKAKGGSFEIVSQSITKATNALKELQRVGAQGQTAIFSKNLSAKFDAQQDAAKRAVIAAASTGRTGSPAEVRAVESAAAKVANNIGKNGLDLKGLESIFQRMVAGANNFTVAEQRIVAQFQAVRLAAQQVGTAADNAAQRNLKSANAQLAALTQVGNQYSRNAQQTAQATAAAKLNLQVQLQQAAAQAKAAAVQNQAAAQAKAVQAAQRTQAAGVALGGVQQQFATQLAGASPAQFNAFNTALQHALQLITTGKVSLQQFQTILNNVTAGNIATQLNPALANLQTRLIAVNNAFNQTTAQSKQAQAAAAALIKVQQAAAAAAQAAAQKQQINLATNIAGQTAQNAFAGQLKGANPQQILAFNAALQNALKLLQTGKINLQQFQTALNNVKAGNITTQLNPALAQLQQRLVALQSAFGGAGGGVGGAGGAAGNHIFLSWQNVVRIFEAQILYSVFNKIQAGFAGATQAAAEYSKQIALIQTISQDAGVSTNQWAEGIRKVSDQLGLPIAETAAAGYEALSNQVAKGADSFKFLKTAGEFARTTGSNITDSVDLISSAINSFELDVTQSERIAKSFFTTIDLGRVKTPELANSFGRSGVLAHQLGISLEELNASISTLTRQGIKPNEAYTLLNNVFQKLIKPTEALEGFFKKLNVASGEQAIQTYGYIGVLEKLDEAFKGSASEAAKYFDEIRGGRGARNLTGSGLGQLKKDLETNLNSGDTYKNAKNIVANSFGQQFDVETNKIKSFFVQDVGGSFLAAIIKLSKAVGGLSNAFITIIGILKAATIAGLAFYSVSKVIPLVAAVGQLRVAFAALPPLLVLNKALFTQLGVTAGAAITVATAGLSILVAGAAAAALAFTDFGDKGKRVARELTDKFQGEADEQIRIQDEAADKQFAAFQKGIDNSKHAFLSFASELRGGLQSVVSSFEKDSEKIGDALKAQFDLIGSLVRSQLQELEKNLKHTVDDIDLLKSDIKDAPEEFNRKLFERNVRKNERNVSEKSAPDDTLRLFTQRINELREQAKIKLFDDDDIKGGVKLLDEAETVANRLAETVRKTQLYSQSIKLKDVYGRVKVSDKPIFQGRGENRHQIGSGEIDHRQIVGVQETVKTKKAGVDKDTPLAQEGERLINELYKERIALDARLLEIKQEKKTLQEQEVNSQRKLFEQLQEAQKNLLEFKPFDKKGDIKKEFEGDEKGSSTDKAVAELRTRQIAVRDILERLGANTDTRIHSATEFAKQANDLIHQLNAQTENVFGSVNNKAALENVEAQVTAITKGYNDISTATGKIKEQEAENNRLRAEAIVQARTQLGILKEQVSQRGFNELREAVAFNTTPTAAASTTPIRPLLDRGNEILGRSKIGPADIAEFQKVVTDLLNEFKKLDNRISGQKFADRATAASPGNNEPAPTVGDAIKGIQNSVATLGTTKAAASQLETAMGRVKTTIDELNAAALRIDPNFKTVGTTAIAAGSAVTAGLSPAIEQANNLTRAVGDIEKALENVIKLKQSIGSLPKGTGGGEASPEGFVNGGQIGYYASGGFLGDFLSGKYAKGADTIPIMAAKGEYMMDAANTRKFLPILRQMSAGKFNPSGASSGSHTTNVGDINITVQGGSTSTQTIKEIGAGIRRGVRQGTIKVTR